MFSLTYQERKVLLFIGILILTGAGLKFFNITLTEPVPTSESPLASLININIASQAELENLPGIGPTTASRIIDYRNQHGEFKTIEDLKEIKGIGDKKAQAVKPYINFENKHR